MKYCAPKKSMAKYKDGTKSAKVAKYAAGTDSMVIDNPFKRKKNSTTNETEVAGEKAQPSKIAGLEIAPDTSDRDLDIVAKQSTSVGKANVPATTNSLAQIADMDKVKQHQEKLNKYGAGLKVDGMWGAKTEAASKDLYPQYKAKSSKSAVSGKGSVGQKSKSVFKGKTEAEPEYYDALEERQKASKARLASTKAAKTSGASGATTSAATTSNGKLAEPAKPIFSGKRDVEGETVLRQLEDAQLYDYENKMKAYRRQEQDAVLDKVDLLKIKNGVDPSTRYKRAQFESVLGKQVEQKKQGDAAQAIKDKQNSVFNKEYHRIEKGQSRKSEAIASYKSDANDAPFKPDASKAIAIESYKKDALVQEKNQGTRDSTDFVRMRGDAQRRYTKDSTATQARRDKQSVVIKSQPKAETKASPSVFKSSAKPIDKATTSSANNKSGGLQIDNSEWTDNPSANARKKQTERDSVFSRASSKQTETELSKNRRTKPYKADKRKARETFMGL